MKILDRQPIPKRETFVFVGEERICVREAQIIVWISLLRRSSPAVEKVARFPAILDTGHTHTIVIQEQHLFRWAGLRSEALPATGHIRHLGQNIIFRDAQLWLHHNDRGKATLSEKRTRMTTIRGIAVFPNNDNFPRLPIFGLRALLLNNLQLTVNGERESATMSTSDWRTRLLDWIR